MGKLLSDDCLDLGHAWDGGEEFWIVWRWMGKGEARRWTRVAERSAPCTRSCGATAVDRSNPVTMKPISRKVVYGKPDYLRQLVNGERPTRHRVRAFRAREQARAGRLVERKE